MFTQMSYGTAQWSRDSVGCFSIQSLPKSITKSYSAGAILWHKWQLVPTCSDIIGQVCRWSLDIVDRCPHIRHITLLSLLGARITGSLCRKIPFCTLSKSCCQNRAAVTLLKPEKEHFGGLCPLVFTETWLRETKGKELHFRWTNRIV